MTEEHAGPCTWRQESEDEGVWETSCGGLHILRNGDPIQNGYVFCSYCGETIIQRKADKFSELDPLEQWIGKECGTDGLEDDEELTDVLEAAPPNNLPDWSECALRVANSDFIAKRVAEGGYSPEPDSKLATQLHRFIYEYDDADPHRSAWFLHRLELVIAGAKR